MATTLDDDVGTPDMSAGLETVERDLEMKQFIKQFFDLPGLDDIIVNDVNLGSKVNTSSGTSGHPFDVGPEQKSIGHQAVPLCLSLATSMPARETTKDHFLSPNVLHQSQSFLSSQGVDESVSKISLECAKLADNFDLGNSSKTPHFDRPPGVETVPGGNGALTDLLFSDGFPKTMRQQLLPVNEHHSGEGKYPKESILGRQANHSILSNMVTQHSPFPNQHVSMIPKVVDSSSGGKMLSMVHGGSISSMDTSLLGSAGLLSRLIGNTDKNSEMHHNLPYPNHEKLAVNRVGIIQSASTASVTSNDLAGICQNKEFHGDGEVTANSFVRRQETFHTNTSPCMTVITNNIPVDLHWAHHKSETLMPDRLSPCAQQETIPVHSSLPFNPLPSVSHETSGNNGEKNLPAIKPSVGVCQNVTKPTSSLSSSSSISSFIPPSIKQKSKGCVTVILSSRKSSTIVKDSGTNVDDGMKASQNVDDGASDIEGDESEAEHYGSTSTDSSDFESISSLDDEDDDDDSTIDDDDACIEGSDLSDGEEGGFSPVAPDGTTPANTSLALSDGCLVSATNSNSVTDAIVGNGQGAVKIVVEPMQNNHSSSVNSPVSDKLAISSAAVEKPNHGKSSVLRNGELPSASQAWYDIAIKKENFEGMKCSRSQTGGSASCRGGEVERGESSTHSDRISSSLKSEVRAEYEDGNVLPPHSDTMTVTLENLARSIHFPYYYNLTMPWMPGGQTGSNGTPPFWPPPPHHLEGSSQGPAFSATSQLPRFNTNDIMVASRELNENAHGVKGSLEPSSSKNPGYETMEIIGSVEGTGTKCEKDHASEVQNLSIESKEPQKHCAGEGMPILGEFPINQKHERTTSTDAHSDKRNERSESEGETFAVKQEKTIESECNLFTNPVGNTSDHLVSTKSDNLEKLDQKNAVKSKDKKRRKKKTFKEKWRRERRRLEEIRLGIRPKEKRASTSKHIVIYDENGKRSWKCPECGKTFSAPGSCNRHIKTHEPQERDWQCEECGKRFVRSSDLARHKKTHTDEKPIKCTECGKGFAEACTLKVHMIRKHNAETPYKCTKCDKKFISKATFEAHMKVHFGVAPYQCSICQKAYVNNTTLRVHMRVHTGEKPYRCKVCNKHYAQSGYLRLHMMTHTGENPVTCPVCNKGFKQTSSMKVHLRMHTGEKPYQCKECGKHFRQSSDLKTHSVVHTHEKPFQCSICGRHFSRTVFRAHLRRHNQEKRFRCNVCGKLLACSSGLEYHMRTHSGEMPFKCSVCAKTFKGQSGLTSHMRLHTGEKPYSCPVCQKSFTQSSSLKTHMKKLHNGANSFSAPDMVPTESS